MAEENQENYSKKRLGQNRSVQPLLTDLYQITMAYTYWKAGKKNDVAVFELFFRKNPFQGEFTIFAGLDDCLKFIENFKFSENDIEYLKQILPNHIEPDFYEYLRRLSTENITIYAAEEGTVMFPKIPLLIVEGPLAIVQLIETTFLNLINYASLMTTNAARYRLAAGNNMRLMEFGIRRAQGPDGALSASKYSFLGGFDSTSNLLAGKLFGIPVSGTHAHSFITAFSGVGDLGPKILRHKDTEVEIEIIELAISWQNRLAALFKLIQSEANTGELAAFISYASAFPDQFVALIDTYDLRKSGLLNFCSVAMALNDLGYKAVGIRIDSGDLAYLSKFSYQHFSLIAEEFKIPWFADILIIVSNDLNEETVISLKDQAHQIKCFGVGTHLVTCQKQPALGCVYKMVEVNGCPRIKISQDIAKITIPGKKVTYRLFGQNDDALIDMMQTMDEPEPVAGEKVLCRHPFDRSKRCYVVPHKIERIQNVYFKDGKIVRKIPSLTDIKQHVQRSLTRIRPDVKRKLNPTPYKIAVSERLFNIIQNLWLENAPIGELY